MWTAAFSLHAAAMHAVTSPPASCTAYPACAALVGDCCPTPQGTALGCCTLGPAPDSPVGPASKAPSKTASKTAVCSAYAGCTALGLQGDCCPTAAGVALGCCSLGLAPDSSVDPPSLKPSLPSPPPSPPNPPPSPPLPPSPPAAPAAPLFGGEPLGSAKLHFPAAAPHQLQPTRLWGVKPRGPLPTNTWWQNIVLDENGKLGENPIYPMPLVVKTLADGLHACAPTDAEKTASVGGVVISMTDVISLGASEVISGRAVIAHDPLSVTMRWQVGTGAYFTAPIVRGSPYVSAIYRKVTPQLKFLAGGGVKSIDGITIPEGGQVSAKGKRFALELGNGQKWTLYTNVTIEIDSVNAGITATAPFSGSLRAARVPTKDPQCYGVCAADEAAQALLDAHASRLHLGGEVHADAGGGTDLRGGTASLRYEWKAEGEGTLLGMALPHQLDTLQVSKGTRLTSLSYASLKGHMRAVVGEAWDMLEVLPSIGFGAPRPMAAHRMPAVRAALQADINKPVGAPDPYGGGKELAALGRLVLIADELGELATAASLRTRLGGLLDGWFSGLPSSTPNAPGLVADPLQYDVTWGGVVSKTGMTDHNADFGNGWYNDHHFHYGYFIYAAAAVGVGNKSFLAKWDVAVRHLVRDIANPTDKDTLYPRSRYKDWYDGHGWANGLFPSPASRNQESISEAVNAWYAISLYGLATSDAKLRDLGRLLLATELRAAWRYWQIDGTGGIYPKEFATNGVVGCLWSLKVDRGTWFGDRPDYTFGIQIMPLTPVTELLVRPSWVNASRAAWSSAVDSATDQWKAFLITAASTLEPEKAWKDAQDLTAFDNGNSRTNMLYWAATRGKPGKDTGMGGGAQTTPTATATATATHRLAAPPAGAPARALAPAPAAVPDSPAVSFLLSAPDAIGKGGGPGGGDTAATDNGDGAGGEDGGKGGGPDGTVRGSGGGAGGASSVSSAADEEGKGGGPSGKGTAATGNGGGAGGEGVGKGGGPGDAGPAADEKSSSSAAHTSSSSAAAQAAKAAKAEAAAEAEAEAEAEAAKAAEEAAEAEATKAAKATAAEGAKEAKEAAAADAAKDAKDAAAAEAAKAAKAAKEGAAAEVAKEAAAAEAAKEAAAAAKAKAAKEGAAAEAAKAAKAAAAAEAASKGAAAGGASSSPSAPDDKGKGGGPSGDGTAATDNGGEDVGKGGGPSGDAGPFDLEKPFDRWGLGLLVLCLGLVVLLLMRCGCRGRGPPAELPPDHPYHSLPERVLTPKKKEDKKKEEEDFDLFEDVGGVR